MPRFGRKNYSRRYRRYGGKRYRSSTRRNYRSFARGKPVTLITHGPRILPDRYMAKLTYNTSGNYTSALGVPSDIVMRGNSLFDPDATGTGGQPTGYDQLASLYFQWTVLASKVTFSCVNTNANAAEMVLAPDTDILASTALELLQTRPYAKTRLLAPAGSGGALHTLTIYMPTAKMYGKNRSAVLDDNQFSGAVTNPIEQWGWHNYVEPVNTGSPIGFSYQIKITYYAVFFDRVPLGAS